MCVRVCVLYLLCFNVYLHVNIRENNVKEVFPLMRRFFYDYT